MDNIAIRDQMRTVLARDIAPQFVGTDLAVQRALFDAMGAQAEIPAGVMISRNSVAGVPVEWISPANRSDRVLIYVHGGGYAIGSCDSYRSLAARLAMSCRAQTVVPEYRLAPEHPFPAALDDVVGVYAALLESGIRADDVLFAGDSAGGGLAIASVIRAQQLGLPRPRALVALSPWTDMTLSGESFRTREAVDPWLRPEMFQPLREGYLADLDPAHPLASPLWADLSVLPPTLIHVGDQEILLSDSLRLAERARAAGVELELELGEELWHVWHFFAPALPDANTAIEQIGAFVDRQFTSDALRDCG